MFIPEFRIAVLELTDHKLCMLKNIFPISTEDFVILELESRTYLVTTLKSLIQVSSGFPKLFDSTTMSFFCEHITVFIFYNVTHPTCTEK